MRFVAVLLSVVLLTLPASATTELQGVQSDLQSLGPVSETAFQIGAYNKATLCVCRESGFVGHLTFMKVDVTVVGPTTVAFQAKCAANGFNVATGEASGPLTGFCTDFEVLWK